MSGARKGCVGRRTVWAPRPAAARPGAGGGPARALGVDGLLAALGATDDGPVEVLRGGRRTAAERHRSLREVVAWSYGLLDDRQRALFEQMSVFAGPVEQAAVSAVCDDPAALPDLVDRSLVVRTSDSPPVSACSRRCGRTDGPGLRPEPTRMRSANATRSGPPSSRRRSGPFGAAHSRARPSAASTPTLRTLRRAHAWMCESGPAEDLLHLSMIFGELAFLRGRIDLVQLVEQALDAVGRPPCPLTARAGRAAGHVELAARRPRRGRGGGAPGDRDCRELRRPDGGARRVQALANVLFFRGEPTNDFLSVLLRALDLAEVAGDIECQVLALVDLVLLGAYAGDDTAAGTL